jgi:hypothetical protein
MRVVRGVIGHGSLNVEGDAKSFFPEPSLPEQLRIFLWERHLAAMVSWLEATPTGN